jgi:hypothetical protein
MRFEVTVFYAENGQVKSIAESCKRPETALRFARSELAYESTVRVVCEALGFDELGDFATLIHLPK